MCIWMKNKRSWAFNKPVKSEIAPESELDTRQSKYATWAPSAPYSCNIGSDTLPEPGNYFDQYEHAKLAEDLLAKHLLREGVAADDVVWVTQEILSRFTARIEQNNEAVMHRDMTHDADPYLHSIVRLANSGKATPSELLEIRQIWDMKSIELGRVSAPSINAREEHVHEMLETISAVLRPEDLLDEPEEYEIDWREYGGADKKSYAKFGVMTVAKKIGKMPDGTIIARRSSYAVVLPKERLSATLPSADELAVALLGDSATDLFSEQLAVTLFAYNKASEARAETRVKVAYDARIEALTRPPEPARRKIGTQVLRNFSQK